MMNTNLFSELDRFCFDHKLVQTKSKLPFEERAHYTLKHKKRKHSETEIVIVSSDYEIKVSILHKKRTLHILPRDVLEIIFDYWGACSTMMLIRDEPNEWVTKNYLKNLMKTPYRKYTREYYLQEAPEEEVRLVKDSKLQLECLLERGMWNSISSAPEKWNKEQCLLALKGCYLRQDLSKFQFLTHLPICEEIQKDPLSRRIPFKFTTWIVNLTTRDLPFISHIYNTVCMDPSDKKYFKRRVELVTLKRDLLSKLPWNCIQKTSKTPNKSGRSRPTNTFPGLKLGLSFPSYEE